MAAEKLTSKSTSQITISVAGTSREFAADYLNPAALEYWRAWIAYHARLAYNPLAEFANKIQPLPPDMRVAAMQGFAGAVDLDAVPKLIVLETATRADAVRVLGKLVTGEDFQADDPGAAFTALYPFIQRPEEPEIVCNSLDEVNRVRAAAGKPPLQARPAQQAGQRAGQKGEQKSPAAGQVNPLLSMLAGQGG